LFQAQREDDEEKPGVVDQNVNAACFAMTELTQTVIDFFIRSLKSGYFHVQCFQSLMAAGFRAVANTRQLRAANSIASARPIPLSIR